MAELNLIEKVIALESVDLLGNLSPEQLASIAMIATDAQVAPGRVIIDAGKPVDALYVIIDGSAGVTRGGELIDTARRNAVLGMWSLFDDHKPAPLGAKALEDTRMLRIGREDFYDLLADNGEIVSAILSALARRFEKLAEE